jgi:hypothetical protein
MLKMEMEEEGFVPHGINVGKPVLSLEDDSKFKQGILTVGIGLYGLPP